MFSERRTLVNAHDLDDYPSKRRAHTAASIEKKTTSSAAGTQLPKLHLHVNKARAKGDNTHAYHSVT